MPKLALDLAWCLSMAEGSASYGGGASQGDAGGHPKENVFSGATAQSR